MKHLLLLTLAVGAAVAAGAARAALTCDANSDGRVTIDELIAGVAAAMASPPDPCSCDTCDAAHCLEGPQAIVDGYRWSCVGMYCEGQEEACVRSIYMEQPLRCVEGLP